MRKLPPMRASVVVGLFCFLPLGLTGCPTPIAPQDAGPDNADGGIVTCVDDEQCSGGFCLNGACSASQCVSKATCLATEVCTRGVCGAPPSTCASSEDCPGRLVCDGFSNTCFDPDNHGGEGEGEGQAGEGEGSAGEGEGEGQGGEGEGGIGEGEGEGGGGNSLDISGFVLENRQNDPVSQAAVFPSGTTVFAGHLIVIGRSATKSEFEGFWGPLPNTVLYLNGNAGTSGVPIINGDETWALLDQNGGVVDGPTIVGASGKCYQRTDAGSAGTASHWSVQADSQATPGSTSLGAGSGLKISEWSDASGNGNFKFEFIELSYQP